MTFPRGGGGGRSGCAASRATHPADSAISYVPARRRILIAKVRALRLFPSERPPPRPPRGGYLLDAIKRGDVRDFQRR